MTKANRSAGALSATSLILTACLVFSNELMAETLPDRRPALVGAGSGVVPRPGHPGGRSQHPLGTGPARHRQVSRHRGAGTVLGGAAGAGRAATLAG